MKAALAALAATLAFGALTLAPLAGALPEEIDKPWCQTDPTGSLIDQFGYRTICDGHLRPDGSWTRKRLFWGESNRVCTPIHTGLGTRRHCIDMPEDNIHAYGDVAEYVVTPDAIPFGEPGFLG